jgi:hypothetical protein
LTLPQAHPFRHPPMVYLVEKYTRFT